MVEGLLSASLIARTCACLRNAAAPPHFLSALHHPCRSPPRPLSRSRTCSRCSARASTTSHSFSAFFTAIPQLLRALLLSTHAHSVTLPSTSAMAVAHQR